MNRLPIEPHAVTIAAAPDPDSDEGVRLLMRCIDELGALEKALVLLHLDGNDHAAIAEVLGISVSNVGTKMGRIKNTLRVTLEERARSTRMEESHGAR